MLPLLGLSKFSFGGGENFNNSYVSYNGKIVAVVQDKMKAGNYFNLENYVTDFDVEIESGNIGTAIVFSLPKKFDDDFSKFLDGKYSQLSVEAKELIYKNSGLPYNFIGPSGKATTHKLLLVLQKHAALKAWMESKLEITIPEQDELWEKPSYEKELIDIESTSV